MGELISLLLFVLVSVVINGAKGKYLAQKRQPGGPVAGLPTLFDRENRRNQPPIKTERAPAVFEGPLPQRQSTLGETYWSAADTPSLEGGEGCIFGEHPAEREADKSVSHAMGLTFDAPSVVKAVIMAEVLARPSLRRRAPR